MAMTAARLRSRGNGQFQGIVPGAAGRRAGARPSSHSFWDKTKTRSVTSSAVTLNRPVDLEVQSDPAPMPTPKSARSANGLQLPTLIDRSQSDPDPLGVCILSRRIDGRSAIGTEELQPPATIVGGLNVKPGLTGLDMELATLCADGHPKGGENAD